MQRVHRLQHTIVFHCLTVKCPAAVVKILLPFAVLATVYLSLTETLLYEAG